MIYSNHITSLYNLSFWPFLIHLLLFPRSFFSLPFSLLRGKVDESSHPASHPELPKCGNNCIWTWWPFMGSFPVFQAPLPWNNHHFPRRYVKVIRDNQEKAKHLNAKIKFSSSSRSELALKIFPIIISWRKGKSDKMLQFHRILAPKWHSSTDEH